MNIALRHSDFEFAVPKLIAISARSNRRFRRQWGSGDVLSDCSPYVSESFTGDRSSLCDFTDTKTEPFINFLDG